MAEVVLNAGSEGKRRLPVWMQGPLDDDGSGNHGGKAKRKPPVTVQSQNGSAQYAIERTAGVSENSIISIPQELELSEETNRTRRPRTRVTRGEKCLKNVLSSRETRSTKKAKREITQLGRVVHDRNSPEAGARKRKRSKKSKQQTPSAVELTVEDLQSIAREYVSAAAYPEASVTSEQHVPNALPLCSSKAFENEREEPRAVGPSLKRCGSSVPLPGRAVMEEVHVTGNQDFSSGIAGTGDATQDILNLFLGPLLRKTPVSRQDSEPPGIDIAAVARQPDRDVRSVAPPPFKIEANMEKKKSSLKDKVSMFLE